MKTLYIKDLQKSQLIENEVFAIFSVKKGEDKNGKPYYNLEVGDKSGRMAAKIWSDNIKNVSVKEVKEGKLVKISGKIDEFKNQLQLNILSLSGVDEGALEEFVESSEFSADEMYQELIDEVKTIKRKDLQKVVLEIVNNKDIQSKFKYWPAANTVHHNFRSGLLQHVLEMLTISKGLERFYPNVDFDVLKTGIILHDLGKIFELDGASLAVPYTKQGNLLGHIYMGARLFEEYAKGKMDEDCYIHVLHLILSHHGKLEYGSPVLPSTVEAILLSYIDNVSAKARTADSVKSQMTKDTEFSDRIFWLENAKMWNFPGSIVEEILDSPSEDVPDTDQIPLV